MISIYVNLINLQGGTPFDYKKIKGGEPCY